MLSLRSYITEKTVPLNSKDVNIRLKPLRTLLKKEVTVQEVSKHLNKTFREIDFVPERNYQVPENDMWVSASYDPDKDEDRENAIEILLLTRSDKKMMLSDDTGEKVLAELSKAIVHEYIHAVQFRKREFIPNRRFKERKSERRPNENRGVTDEKRYYGNPDEIEAFAHNIATELMSYSDKPLTLLKSYEKTSKIKVKGNLLSPDFYNYINFFGKNHRVIKTLVKRIAHFIEVMEKE